MCRKRNQSIFQNVWKYPTKFETQSSKNKSFHLQGFLGKWIGFQIIQLGDGLVFEIEYWMENNIWVIGIWW